MPFGIEDLEDPFFLSLPDEEQRKGRREVFRELTKDPAFRALPQAERQKVLFPAGTPPVTGQAMFEESLGLPPGYSGGTEAVPFTQDPATLAVLGGVGAPIGIGPSVLYGGRGAALAEQVARGAGTMLPFGAFQGGEEAVKAGKAPGEVARSAVKGGFKEALYGGAFAPAVAPASSLIRGIAKPAAIGAGVGFATAEKGEGLQGAAQGAGLFLGGKAITGGIGRAGEALSRARGATRNLFSRPAAGAQPSVDAPAGLTDEVFGLSPTAEALRDIGAMGKAVRRESTEELERFGRFYEGQRSPQEILEANLQRTGAEAEEFLAGKTIMPGLPAPFKQREGISGAVLPIEPPRVFVPGAPIRMQDPNAIRGLPPPLTNVPAAANRVAPTEFGLPPIAPPSVFVPHAPIRMPGPRIDQLIQGAPAELVPMIRQRLSQGGPLSPEEIGALRGLDVPGQEEGLREVARLGLRRFPEQARGTPIEMKGPPPFVPFTKGQRVQYVPRPDAAPIDGRIVNVDRESGVVDFRAKAGGVVKGVSPDKLDTRAGTLAGGGGGPVADVDRDAATYIRNYMKGINPGALQEEFRTAAGKQSFRFLSAKGMAADEAAESYSRKVNTEPTVDAVQDLVRRSAGGERIFSSQSQRAKATTKQRGGDDCEPRRGRFSYFRPPGKNEYPGSLWLIYRLS